MKDMFYDLSDEQKQDIAGIVDNEGLYYALMHGMIKPEEFIKDDAFLAKVKEAISTITDLESEMMKADLHF